MLRNLLAVGAAVLTLHGLGARAQQSEAAKLTRRVYVVDAETDGVYVFEATFRTKAVRRPSALGATSEASR